MNTFWIRLFSALVGLAILFFIEDVMGRNGVAILSSLAAVVYIVEYTNLISASRPLKFTFLGVAVGLLYVGIFAETLFPIELGLAFILLSMMVLLEIRKAPEISKAHHHLGMLTFGVFYCSLLPFFIFRILYAGPDSRWFILFLSMVFAGDTGAYLVGKLFGKTKLFAEVSPNKSVEGALGGLICTLLAATIVYNLYAFQIHIGPILLCSLVVGCIAQMGDLVESLLKRACNVKDSGSLMPGHGGMMDRLDGVYFSSPVFFWFLDHWLK